MMIDLELASNAASGSLSSLAFQVVVGTMAFVYLVHVLHRFAVPKVKPSYTLYLRKLKQSGGDMLEGNETGNIFLEEYNLVTDLVFPVLDLCVMKALDGEISILSKQEQLHAAMHNQAKKERTSQEQGMGRWAWYVAIADFFLLRAGKEVGHALAGHAEATTSIWMYLPMVLPMSKGFMNNEYVYHSMEELEHGPLTTQFLRTRVSTLSPLLVFPVIFIFFAVYFLFPPIVAILANPLLLLHLKTYKDLVLYYCAMIPTFVAAMSACIMYWVLPFREDDEMHEKVYQFFLQKTKERGIEFNVVDQQTFRMEGNKATLVKCDG